MADKQHAFDHGASSVLVEVDFRTALATDGYTHTVTYTVDAGTPVVLPGITSKNLPSFLSALETKIKANIDGAPESELSALILPMGYVDP